jgi:hypothetical protein
MTEWCGWEGRSRPTVVSRLSWPSMALGHRSFVRRPQCRRYPYPVDLETWCLWFKRRGAGRLRRVLMRTWDPIGVRGEPLARDEYDRYVPWIAEHLRSGADANSIADLLGHIERDRM